MPLHLDESQNSHDHVKHARKVANAALIALLAIALFIGALTTHFQKHHLPEPQALAVMLFLMPIALLYLWYYYDSMERSFARSRVTNVGIILLAVAVLPYYLASSRPRGQRLKAILRLSGFVLCYLVLVALGALVTRLVPAL